MAVQEKEKKNRVIQAISHEWKYENLILVVLALFALELGVLLLTGDLTISSTAFLIGPYWKVFAWILVGLGVIALLLAVASFYRPSIAEIKHVTGLKRKEFIVNVFTVFIFILVIDSSNSMDTIVSENTTRKDIVLDSANTLVENLFK